jgi:hypothetical protein
LWLIIGSFKNKVMESKLEFNFTTTQAILRKIAAIDAFQSRWQVEQADEQAFLKQAKAQTMYESTGSSTRIEGATLTNWEVESLLKNKQIIENEGDNFFHSHSYYCKLWSNSSFALQSRTAKNGA